MRRSHLARLLVALAAAALAAPATAHQTYYASSCSKCHGTTVETCNGCHAHGTHGDTLKNGIDVAGTLDAASYAPGATVTVTITGGYRTGWVRTLLLGADLTELARGGCPSTMGGCTTAGYPVTLTAPAPTEPGTYAWSVAWYGNFATEASGASFGAGQSSTLKPGWFTPDPDNAGHGWQVVALPAFTVTAPPPDAPAVSVAPTSLAFGGVAVGSTASKTFTVSSAGTATLTGAVALADGTSAAYSVAPATFSLAPGASQAVTVTFAPSEAADAAGAVVVTSDDAARPSVSVALSGTGTSGTTGTPTPPATTDPAAPATGGATSGGCSTGAGGGGPLALLALAALAARRGARRRGSPPAP